MDKNTRKECHKRNNEKKAIQLGMPYGTANGRLRKKILFNLLQRYGDNICFRCGSTIDCEEHLSIEHKIPWLDNDINLFWDLDNIAFSHLRCNICAGKRKEKTIIHGNTSGYRYGCRCKFCTIANRDYRRYRRVNRLDTREQEIDKRRNKG